MILMNREIEGLIEEALIQLGRAVQEMMKPTRPATPLPRERIFEFAPEVVWPYCYGGRVDFAKATAGGYWYALPTQRGGAPHLVQSICRGCNDQPRRLLRALRRIQAATAWCLARAEGRRRAAQEILRQQAKALSILEAEIAIRKLAE